MKNDPRRSRLISSRIIQFEPSESSGQHFVGSHLLADARDEQAGDDLTVCACVHDDGIAGGELFSQ
jgi:hypothetical protein